MSRRKVGIAGVLIGAVLRKNGRVVELRSILMKSTDLFIVYPGGREILNEAIEVLALKAIGHD